ncbi:hypothetical protein GUJ93_ZPchr0006g43495 [Zizania palustris]|uniref:Uncharacterized protein n=1 Tax=Zizania palustris TaxID=103762 RepID=A0A8J5SB47_ZIZPA|nr:hypothetical protein GUJ93_ZPchr0006g43495 [Zizania palustris]
MPDGCVVIRLPDPRLLRVIARSVLLAVALLSLAWLRADDEPASRRDRDACGVALQASLLLRDLRREGLLAPGSRAVFLGADGDCHPPALKQYDAMRPISLRELLMTADLSVDFVLDFGYFNEDGGSFSFVDRVLKDGGIVASPIGSARAFRLPQNYRVVYVTIRLFLELNSSRSMGDCQSCVTIEFDDVLHHALMRISDNTIVSIRPLDHCAELQITQ